MGGDARRARGDPADGSTYTLQEEDGVLNGWMLLGEPTAIVRTDDPRTCG